MASTSVDTTKAAPQAPPVAVETVSEPVKPTKNRRGRPTLPENQKVQVAKPEETYEDPDFFDWLKTFPENDWSERLFMYLWRCEPITDRGATGNFNYIQKFSEPTDIQRIMEAPYGGSGKYKIILNRYNPETRRTTPVRVNYFTIMNQEYPPRLPLAEWIDDARNSRWQWAKELLEEEAQKKKEAKAGAAATAAGQAGELFKMATDYLDKQRPNSKEENQGLATQIIKLMQDNHRDLIAANNPEKMLGMIKLIADTIGANKNDGGGMMPFFLQQMQNLQAELAEERKRTFELLTKKNEAPAPKSLKEQLEEARDIANMFRRAPEAEASNGWLDLAQAVLPDVAKTLGAVAHAVITRPRPVVVNQPGQQQQQQPPPVSINPTLPAAGADPTQPYQEPDLLSQLTPEQREQAENINRQLGTMLDNAVPFMVDFFQRGCHGAEFRDWFIDAHGNLTYGAIKKQDPAILSALIELRKRDGDAKTKELLSNFGPPPEAAEFIAEFLSDADPDEETPTPDEQATATTKLDPTAQEDF